MNSLTSCHKMAGRESPVVCWPSLPLPVFTPDPHPGLPSWLGPQSPAAFQLPRWKHRQVTAVGRDEGMDKSLPVLILVQCSLPSRPVLVAGDLWTLRGLWRAWAGLSLLSVPLCRRLICGSLHLQSHLPVSHPFSGFRKSISITCFPPVSSDVLCSPRFIL